MAENLFHLPISYLWDNNNELEDEYQFKDEQYQLEQLVAEYCDDLNKRLYMEALFKYCSIERILS